MPSRATSLQNGSNVASSRNSPSVLRRDDTPWQPSSCRPAVELLAGVGAAERVRMRCGDEAARIVALGFLGLVVDEARGLQISAHALRAGEPGRVDAGRVHHLHVLVEIVEQLVDRIARRALGVVVQDQAVARSSLISSRGVK